MATYIDAYKGYIADVPIVWFKRCDGKIFHYDEITSASVEPQTNYMEVNGGWSSYPTAYLPGASTMEVTMESGQFNADLFAMANNRTFEENDDEYGQDDDTVLVPAPSPGGVPVTNSRWLERTLVATPGNTIRKYRFANCASVMPEDWKRVQVTLYPKGVEATLITLASGILDKDDLINSFQALLDEAIKSEQKRNPDKNYQLQTVTSVSADGLEYTQGSNSSAPDGFKIKMVCVERYRSTQVIKIDNKASAIGEVVMKWPIYASGEDCTDSAIKGHLVVHMYKCRVSAMPGFNTSYKQASTNSVTWSTMDPKREDKAVYSIAYLPLSDSYDDIPKELALKKLVLGTEPGGTIAQSPSFDPNIVYYTGTYPNTADVLSVSVERNDNGDWGTNPDDENFGRIELRVSSPDESNPTIVDLPITSHQGGGASQVDNTSVMGFEYITVYINLNYNGKTNQYTVYLHSET